MVSGGFEADAWEGCGIPSGLADIRVQQINAAVCMGHRDLVLTSGRYLPFCAGETGSFFLTAPDNG